MTAVVLSTLNNCFECIPDRTEHGTKVAKPVIGGAMVLDVLAIISALVIAILGITATMHLPPTATYALFGGAGAFILLYAAKLIHSCCKKPAPSPAAVGAWQAKMRAKYGIANE